MEDGQRTKRHLAAQYETARAVAESATVSEAVQRILRAICETLNCEHGCFWIKDRKDQVLRCFETWHSPHAESAQFEEIARSSVFSLGIGLPGRIWATRQPAWISGVTEDADVPRALAASIGDLHNAFGLPILSGDEVHGVLEFFSTDVREFDEGLLPVLTSIGSQISQGAARRQTEEALRQSEARTGLIVDAALDAVVTMDENGMIAGWNVMAERTFGWSSQEAIGRRLSHTIIPFHYRDRHEKGLDHFLAAREGPVLNKRIEITALHRDGHEFPVELAITLEEQGGSWIFSGFVRDITERKRTEAIREQAKEAAEASNRAKRSFWPTSVTR